MWIHAVPAPARTDARPDPSVSSVLVAAAAERRQVRLGYRSAGGSVLERTVDPWVVVARRRWFWYLLCWDHSVQAVRTYRVDRVLHVATLVERFDPRPDLDPVALVEQHLGSGRRYATRVRFDAPVVQVRPFVGPARTR